MIYHIVAQLGLTFELTGAYVLALPGLARPSRRLPNMQFLRWPVGVSVAIGIAGTIVIAISVILYLKHTVLLWLLALLLWLAWIPTATKLAQPALPSPGNPMGDAQKEALSTTGFCLLLVGFALQGLATAIN